MIFDDILMKNIVIFNILQKSYKISEISIGFPIVKICAPKNFRKFPSHIFFGNFKFSNRFRVFTVILNVKNCV